MSNTYNKASRAVSGTYSQVWLNGEIVAEAESLQMKYTFTKEPVLLGGQMVEDSKITSAKGTGSLGLTKVFSRMAVLLEEVVKSGTDPRFTIVSKLKDPDSFGTERVSVENVSFDELTLADWALGKVGKETCPFTFTDHELLDTIDT